MPAPVLLRWASPGRPTASQPSLWSAARGWLHDAAELLARPFVAAGRRGARACAGCRPRRWQRCWQQRYSWSLGLGFLAILLTVCAVGQRTGVLVLAFFGVSFLTGGALSLAWARTASAADALVRGQHEELARDVERLRGRARDETTRDSVGCAAPGAAAAVGRTARTLGAAGSRALQRPLAGPTRHARAGAGCRRTRGWARSLRRCWCGAVPGRYGAGRGLVCAVGCLWQRWAPLRDRLSPLMAGAGRGHAAHRGALFLSAVEIPHPVSR
jgi:hypothetical protein